MIPKTVFTSFLLLIMGLRLCGASPIYFRHYQVEDGLSNNTVFSAFQDSRGFMWFGTKEGLNRFDGTIFKPFDIMQDDGSILKEFVYSVNEGLRQTLWVGTRRGLFAFNPKQEQFSLLPFTAKHEVLEILSDQQGAIWFCADQKLYRHDEKTGKNTYFKFRDKHDLSVSAIAIGEDKTIWASSSEGYIFRYHPVKNTFQCINSSNKMPFQQVGGVNALAATPSGQLLIGTVRSLMLFDPQHNSYRHILHPDQSKKPVYIRDIKAFQENEYWIASENGLYVLTLGDSFHYEAIKKESRDPYAISDNAVYTLCKDNEGGMWIGTYFGGINYYHSSHGNFRKHVHYDTPNSLGENAVRELRTDGKGNLWIGTEDSGLNLLNLKTGKLSKFDQTSSANVHALLINNDELWVGTFEQGLDIFDLKTGEKLRHYDTHNSLKGLSSDFIISACRTRSGEILIGTSHGVYRYNRKKDRFEQFDGFPPNSYVFCLYEDTKQIIWAGTIGNGLYSYHPETKEKSHFTYQATNKTSLSSNSVCGISEDSYGHLWVATEGGGLNRLDKSSRQFFRFDTNSGLPSNMVYTIIEDGKKRLWISTSQGLVLHDPKKNTWQVFSKAHGLLTNQFNYSSGFKDAEGNLYFGSVKGLISFNPDRVVIENKRPRLYFTSFQLGNDELPIQGGVMNRSISFADTITLSHDQSSFAIGFAALSYIAANTTPYQFKMDGLEENWSHTSTNRKVYFTDLSPGNYTFQLRTADDIKNTGRKLTIQILPPWWKTPEALFVYAFACLLTAYFVIIHYRKRRAEKEQQKLDAFEREKEKELYNAKIDFFTQVAHEIRTPLTLIKGPLELVIEEIGHDERVQENLLGIEQNTERLVSLTDQLLDFRSTEKGMLSLRFEWANISSLLTKVIGYFELSATQSKLSLVVNLPPEPLYAFVDVEAFNKIVSNLISNGVKYATAAVIIKMSYLQGAQESFIITVESDGMPIPPSLSEKIFEPFYRMSNHQPGYGIGLSLARSLATLHDGELVLQHSDGERNLFILNLPIRRNQLR